MQINLKKLSSTEIFNFDTSSTGWLQDILKQYNENNENAESFLKFESQIQRRSDKEYFLRGELKGHLSFFCSRCLKETPLVFEMPVLGLFVYGDDPLGKIDSKDLIETDIQFLQDGEEINLSDIVRDNVENQLPLAPLCSEACKGLCQECGNDLNKTQCNCQASIFNGLSIKI